MIILKKKDQHWPNDHLQEALFYYYVVEHAS
jgi:hypothetical protein